MPCCSPPANADRPSPYSGQFQHAADFYNLALTQVLSGAGAEGVAKLQSGRYDAAVRRVDVAVDQASLTFAGRTLTSFVPTMNLEVQGFKNDYRSDGIGAPLAAGLEPRHTRTVASCCRRTCAFRPRPCCRWMTRAGN